RHRPRRHRRGQRRGVLRSDADDAATDAAARGPRPLPELSVARRYGHSQPAVHDPAHAAGCRRSGGMLGLLQRLRRDEGGLAFVEFAFAGPIVLFLILAGLELVNCALAHLRVHQTALTVADTAGRVVTGLDEANVY